MILKIMGWQLDEQLPAHNKYVLIAYPHTSNWDFILGMLAKWAMDLPLNWVAKHSMFWGPFGPIFKAMGGVPIDRDKTSGFIQKNIALFQERNEFVLGIMPEGTRSKTERLKTGFYHIADGANVPLVLAYLDYKNKKLGVGKVLETTGDITSDFIEIEKFYKNMTGYKPQNQTDLVIDKK
ncbi:MAG: lysophospholipid acyltransferase family protein [Gammaproteobacteria bacterium]|nr:lysophospholipid acyltransferase family protein [Gammaproteobacteria bacterium]